MISEVLNMNGYGVYVFFIRVTLVSFGVLYSVIKIQLKKN